MLANSHLTAITRKGPSAPCRWLHKQGRIEAPVLDWGCGKGADRAFLDGNHVYAVGYDPHYRPKKPLPELRFKTILCTYVLNVIPEYHDRCAVIGEALEYLDDGGWLYVTIRCNQKDLNGYTQRGTWQGYVGEQLEVGGFTLIRKLADYEIWGWQKK